MNRTVGLIGLGLLGTAVAERLQACGDHVLGCDVDAVRRSEHSRAGRPLADNATALWEAADLVVLCLPNSTIVQQVIREVEPAVRARQVVVDLTTGDLAATLEFYEWFASRGVLYVDAPVAGSSERVRTGNAMTLVGGNLDDQSTVRELLEDAFGKVHELGCAGDGLRMKLVFNMVLGLHRAVLAEGLAFAEALGLTPDGVLQVLQSGAAASQVMQDKGLKMLSADFAPQARLRQHAKDVGLMLEAASTVGARIPLSQLHAELLAESIEAGDGDLDNSAIFRRFLPAVLRARD